MKAKTALVHIEGRLHRCAWWYRAAYY